MVLLIIALGCFVIAMSSFDQGDMMGGVQSGFLALWCLSLGRSI